ACYAEFGVRVPHTTGSAYMYSYVTVGEFVAFVIGWNMILEYLIGTSACACALSACIDAIFDGKINRGIKDTFGTIYGNPPDILAFFIILFMMVLMVSGVRKSLIFTHVMNVLNLATLIFAIGAGLFYVDIDNWKKHDGFFPYGWSGVLTGAATCFYAFIGFDIIATTGEEAVNPKKSIPKAIVGSLVVALTAYTVTSLLITLMVPYPDIAEDSGLVEAFNYVRAPICHQIVAIGALTGLTVAMFGSMFPMPRVVYAMARDGLIFRFLGRVSTENNVPGLATFIFGLAAALAALLLSLEVLVQMMSIGTLLAYTLVSTCVLILRYQPQSTTLVELLPESLRTPIPGSPVMGTPSREWSKGDISTALQDSVTGLPAPPPPPPQVDLQLPFPSYLQSTSTGNSLFQRKPTGTSGPGQTSTNPFEGFKNSMGAAIFLKDPSNNVSPAPPIVTAAALPSSNVTVKRVTRSNIYQQFSVDSDSTITTSGTEEGREDYLMVGDSAAERFYGSIAAGDTTEKMTLAQRVKRHVSILVPQLFPWTHPGPATEKTGNAVMKLVGIMYAAIIFFDLTIVAGVGDLINGSIPMIVLLLTFFACIVFCLLLISRQPQNCRALPFLTPCLPVVPSVAVTVNIYLIFKLSYLTLIRFLGWMTLGFLVYFFYGINESDLELEAQKYQTGASTKSKVTLTANTNPFGGGKSTAVGPNGHVKIIDDNTTSTL
ncbi:unnamed protein product, partial [Cyprideis torosa]